VIDLFFASQPKLPEKPPESVKTEIQAGPDKINQAFTEIEITPALKRFRQRFDLAYEAADTAKKFFDHLNQPGFGYELTELQPNLFYLSNPDLKNMDDAWAKEALNRSPAMLQASKILLRLNVVNNQGNLQQPKIVLSAGDLGQNWGGNSMEGSYAYKDDLPVAISPEGNPQAGQKYSNSRIYPAMLDSRLFQTGPRILESDQFVADEIADRLMTEFLVRSGLDRDQAADITQTIQYQSANAAIRSVVWNKYLKIVNNKLNRGDYPEFGPRTAGVENLPPQTVLDLLRAELEKTSKIFLANMLNRELPGMKDKYPATKSATGLSEDMISSHLSTQFPKLLKDFYMIPGLDITFNKQNQPVFVPAR
jgi:hypothetical protein